MNYDMENKPSKATKFPNIHASKSFGFQKRPTGREVIVNFNTDLTRLSRKIGRKRASVAFPPRNRNARKKEAKQFSHAPSLHTPIHLPIDLFNPIAENQWRCIGGEK